MNKKLTIFVVLMVSAIAVFSQSKTIPNSFKIINNQHPEKETFYIVSIGKADMEKYRLKDKQVTLKFENGFECLMLSAKELFMNGSSINAASYEESFSPKFPLPVFNILESGQLMAIYPSERKKLTR